MSIELKIYLAIEASLSLVMSIELEIYLAIEASLSLVMSIELKIYLAIEASLSLVMSIELEIYFIYIFIYIRTSAHGFTAKQKDKSTKRRCQMNAILAP